MKEPPAFTLHPSSFLIASPRPARFKSAMIRFLAMFAAALALAACTLTPVMVEPARQVPIAKANVLPLELSEDFQVRKCSFFFNDPRDPRSRRATADLMVAFERQRVNYGAVSGYDRGERYGHYYNIYWRAKRKADLTVRFEYRQENLGALVLAKEYYYPGVEGTHESKFSVIGDEYAEDGRVTSWRVLLIENGKVVGLHQSYLWD